MAKDLVVFSTSLATTRQVWILTLLVAILPALYTASAGESEQDAQSNQSAAALAGDTIVYSSTGGNVAFSTGVAYDPITDDLRLTAGCGCDVTSYTVRVTGSGDGSSIFDATVSLWDDCPSRGGQQIMGTGQTFTALSTAGTHDLIVDLSAAPLSVSNVVWLQVSFSTPQAGVIVGVAPELGTSIDSFDRPGANCDARIDTATYAAFYAQLFCATGVSPAAPDMPLPSNGALNVPEMITLRWNTSAPAIPSAGIVGISNDQVAFDEWTATIAKPVAAGDPPWCATEQLYATRNRNLLAPEGALTCPLDGECDRFDVRDIHVPSPSSSIKTYRMMVHVFCDDSGSNCASTQSTVDAQLAKLNANFAPWRIQFLHNTQFVNDSQFRSFSFAEESAMKLTYAQSPASQLNVFVVFNNDFFSFGTFPWDPVALTPLGGIVMHQSHFQPNGNILAHEVGHNLGLWHTHHGVSEVTLCSACYEEVNGTDNDNTGDRCSDTSPTPTNFSCAPPGGIDPCSGNPWGTTDFQNYMGYAPSLCVNQFSPQQAGRAHCWTEDVLSGWLADQCITPVTFDVLFGTVNPPSTVVCADTTETACEVGLLDCTTTYYWSVVAKNPLPGQAIQGPIWSFTTDGGAPSTPSAPVPVDGASEVSVLADLSWNDGAVVNTGKQLFASVPTSNSIITIDQGTGQATPQISVAGSSGRITEIEWSPDGSTLYATTGGGFSTILTIDIDTGLVLTAVTHPFGAINGLEFDDSGLLLGTFIPGPSLPSNLVSINPTTGALATIGATGYSNIGGLAFDAGFSQLFGVTSGQSIPPKLLTLNPLTGTATEVGNINVNTEISSLEFLLDGRLVAGASDGNFYEIDPNTGQASLIGSMGVQKVSGLSVREGAAEPCTPSFDVLFGTDNPPTGLLCTYLTSPHCALPPLDCNATYYWMVKATSRRTGEVASGPIWSFATRTQPDCNGNGEPDECDLVQNTSNDCNDNGVPDECDIAQCAGDPSCDDCNANGVPDGCEPDCNNSGQPDTCDVMDGTSPDCNNNMNPDECDLSSGSSSDCNFNDLPDECDVTSGSSEDCNMNGVPDECDTVSCGLPGGTCPGQGDCCAVNGTPGCDCSRCCQSVCSFDSFCCDNAWDGFCAFIASIDPNCDCGAVNPTGSEDCNSNAIPDECEVADGTVEDCNVNMVPDSCERDCNQSGQPDDCDLDDATSFDCNNNRVPDECDIVVPDTADGQDACSDAQIICPGNLYTGSTGRATNDGSATCGFSTTSPDVWYRYTPVATATFAVSLCNSSYDTVVSVHTGCPGNVSTQVACNDDSCFLQSRVSVFNAIAGQEYFIRVSGYAGSIGNFELIIQGVACAPNSADCNLNDIPDDCEPDCNQNNIADACDISDNTSEDCDLNGVPDDCQPDGDGDGVVCDNCPNVFNPDQGDSDSDGVGDTCDTCFLDPLKTIPGLCGCGIPDQGDDDNDGVLDCVDQCPGVDDSVFAPDCLEAIPTTTAWGTAIIVLTLLIAGKLVFPRNEGIAVK